MALAALDEPRVPNRFKSPFYFRDPEADLPAIDFKLGFPGASRADAASEAGHRDPFPGQTREKVLELSVLDLQLAFARACPLGEDIEDELGSIDNAGIELGFDVTELRGAELIVENDKIRLAGFDSSGEFFEFAFADEMGSVGHVANLCVDIDDLRPGAGGERAKLFERFFWREVLLRPSTDFNRNQNCLLRAGLRKL